MKKVLLFLMLFSVLKLSAQEKLSYAYDASGNRISRTIVLNTKSASVVTKSALKKQTTNSFFEEVLSQKQVKLYPNPVKSHLTVEINGYDSNLNGTLMVYDMNGRKLINQNINESRTLLNMSSFLTGTYVMHIVLNGEKSVWKVIKQ